MNESVPRKRFRFSLRFLLAWVLLTGLLLHKSFEYALVFDNGIRMVDDPELYLLSYDTLSFGWPCTAYEIEREFPLVGRIDGPIPLEHPPKYLYGGLALNILSCAAASLAVCVTLQFILLLFSSAYSASSAVENKRG
jgi:hypothetical protein